MIEWLKTNEAVRRRLLNQVNFTTGFSTSAIEKDWYVTLALMAVFQTKWKDDIIFKGGTSLSKGWKLINRFSEDVDLAIRPAALGFDKEVFADGDIRRLRKASATFMGGEFLQALTAEIRAMGVTEEMLQIQVQEISSSDTDPRTIELQYQTLYPVNNYVRAKVLLEVGARSLREPFTMRPINSLVSQYTSQLPYGELTFEVPTVNPGRTMLEKMFLLHEEFTKPPTAKRKHERMSRHLYDINSLMNSAYGPLALQDKELFDNIRKHRGVFNPHPHIDYANTRLESLIIIPPNDIIRNWENDYNEMLISMLGTDAPAFPEILVSLQAISEQLKTAHSS